MIYLVVFLVFILGFILGFNTACKCTGLFLKEKIPENQLKEIFKDVKGY